MKRSAPTEVERDAATMKRPRLDTGQNEAPDEKCLDKQEEVTNLADIPSTPACIASNAMELLNATTTIHDLPLEILGNHVFKFFDFQYWLKHFTNVSKFWLHAAVQSTLDKQLAIQRPHSVGIVKRYRVSTLLINFDAYLPDIALLINASPRVNSVQFNYEVNDFDWALTPAAISKFSFNNVSTLYLPASQLKLLNFFPKASKISISGKKFSSDFTSTLVQEVALQQRSLTDIQQALIETKTIFPAVQTIYFFVDERATKQGQPSELEVAERLGTISVQLGVSLIYKYRNNTTAQLDLSYDEFFNTFGHTPFCHSCQSLDTLQHIFQQFPTLTLEYEQDFITRKRQFLFPQVIVTDEQEKNITDISWINMKKDILQLCYERNLLPPKGMYYYHIKQGDYKAAIDVWKSHQQHPISESLWEAIPSLVQLSVELGPEAFKTHFGTDHCFSKQIIGETYEDIASIKDLLPNDVIKKGYSQLMRQMYRQGLSSAEFEYLAQIDSWLHPSSSRRVSNQPNIGIQFLSDEAQAKHFAQLLQYNENEKIISNSENASKPLNLMLHKGKMLQAYFGSKITTEIVTKFNFDVNQIDTFGKTPLIYAIKGDLPTVVSKLLQLGADPNLAGNTLLPLNYCLSLSKSNSRFLATFNALLMYGADINRRDYNSKGRTVWPITMAMSHSAKMVKLVLDMGAEPTVIDEAGNTLLHLLARLDICPHIDDILCSLKLLVPHIDINRKNNLGYSALHCAIYGNNLKLVQGLIDFGADVNLPNVLGYTPLFMATTPERKDIIKALLATNQVDIKARTKEGLSLINVVVMKFQGSCAKLLKDKEFLAVCQPYLTDENIQFCKDEFQNRIPLEDIEELVASHITLARYFVDLGYNVAQNSNTLLYWLRPDKDAEVFNYLLANGLDINAKNEYTDTYLFAVLEAEPLTKEKADKIQFLLKHGASVTEKNQFGVGSIDIDPLLENRYANELSVDYFVTTSDKHLPDVNLMELREKKTTESKDSN